MLWLEGTINAADPAFMTVSYTHLEASVSAPQAITANIMAATLVLCMLYNILATGELVARMTTFSSKTVNVRPLLSKRRAA